MATNNKSSGVLIDKDQLKQKWALQFLIACVLLAALIFGLINALMYFSDRARAQLAAPFAKTLGLECLLHTPRALKRVKVPGPYVHIFVTPRRVSLWHSSPIRCAATRRALPGYEPTLTETGNGHHPPLMRQRCP